MNSEEHLTEASGECFDSAQEINAVEGSDDGTRLPTVNRSVRLKQQRNWKWKWWCFTKGRVLQPISETAETPKDETSKDENVLPSDGENEQDPEWSGDCTSEQCENNTESNQETDGTRIQDKDLCIATETTITSPKDQYSACYKLIEKFQEAVLENAVRIIQAAFKRFTLRRRFLRLRRAATVIQRNVRKWLQQRRGPVHVNGSAAGESLTISSSHFAAKEQTCKKLNSCLKVDNLETTVEADDTEVMGDKVWHEIENSESEFLQPDTWGHSPSPLQNLKLAEPDSVSLTDSGIDACSVASVEAAIEETYAEFKAGIECQDSDMHPQESC